MTRLSSDKPITIAIIAMGGQGGGVLSKWIIDLAQSQGYLAQYTSVPGVAQRTGATVYYIEIFPEHLADQAGAAPVLALMPIAGDVDIVIASEMIEAGRALMRGFVTDTTTLIASDHRDYAIVEKQVMGDGRRDTAAIKALSEKTAAQYICFNMDDAARQAGTVISSVLFGALAASKALPFSRETFEATIRSAKKAVDSNLRGFSVGFDRAQGLLPTPDVADNTSATESLSPKISFLLSRIDKDFPANTHFMLRAGLKKTIEFQDIDYGHLYLDRMQTVLPHDSEKHGWKLTKHMARYLALAMAYDDTAYVADIKTQKRRFLEFRDNVKAEADQIVHIAEYMHPRLEEIADIMPVKIGNFIHNNTIMRRFLNVFLGKGRRIRTTHVTGFCLLKCVASFRHIRRKSLRYHREEARIARWMDDIWQARTIHYDLACEIAGLQRLIKGYSDTYERGQHNIQQIMAAYHNFKTDADAAQKLAHLKHAALKDEEGQALHAALNTIKAKAA